MPTRANGTTLVTGPAHAPPVRWKITGMPLSRTPPVCCHRVEITDGKVEMRRGRGGHPCDPDLSVVGLWRCPECGQGWEIHGVAGVDVRARKVSRVAWFFVNLLR